MFHNLPVKVAVMLLILRTGVEAAPTERGELWDIGCKKINYVTLNS